MLTTSASVVAAPSFFNLAITFFDDAKDLRDLAVGDAMILRYFDPWLKPDLQLTVR